MTQKTASVLKLKNWQKSMDWCIMQPGKFFFANPSSSERMIWQVDSSSVIKDTKTCKPIFKAHLAVKGHEDPGNALLVYDSTNLKKPQTRLVESIFLHLSLEFVVITSHRLCFRIWRRHSIQWQLSKLTVKPTALRGRQFYNNDTFQYRHF